MDGCHLMMKSSLDELRPEPWPKMWQKFDIEGMCIRNLFHQDRWWVENSFATFWGDWGKTANPTSRQMVQQLLDPASWQNFSSRIACAAVFGFHEDDRHPPPSLLTRPHPLWFFPIPKDEIEAQGATFGSIEEFQTKLQYVMKMLTWNDFQQCFWLWKSAGIALSMQKGDYSEGDGGE